jgi:hypothetical protein
MTETVSRSASAEFSRFWKPRGIVFVLGVILPNAFPGWAASAATSLTYLFSATPSFPGSLRSCSSPSASPTISYLLGLLS